MTATVGTGAMPASIVPIPMSARPIAPSRMMPTARRTRDRAMKPIAAPTPNEDASAPTKLDGAPSAAASAGVSVVIGSTPTPMMPTPRICRTVRGEWRR